MNLGENYHQHVILHKEHWHSCPIYRGYFSQPVFTPTLSLLFNHLQAHYPSPYISATLPSPEPQVPTPRPTSLGRNCERMASLLQT